MTTKDFLKMQLDDSGHQVDAVFAGLPEDQWDARVVAEAMSPRETAEHLAECYIALQDEAQGRKHDWGSYSAPDKSGEALIANLKAERAKAEELALASDDPGVWAMASSFVALHDAYHVGQMVTLRLTLGDFNPYSIYKSH